MRACFALSCGLALLLSSAAAAESRGLDAAWVQGELRLRVDEDAAALVATAGEIAAGSERQVREMCSRWKIRTSELQQTVLAEPDPRRAYVVYWSGIVQFRLYIEEGSGRGQFGAGQERAVALVRRVEEGVVALGNRLFGAEAVQAARAEIEGEARRRVGVISGPTRGAEPAGGMFKLLKLPLLPMTTLQNVANAPKEVGDAARDAAARIEAKLSELMLLLRTLPEQSRWQAELLLQEAGETGPAPRLAAEIEAFGKQLQAASESLRLVPSEARGEFEASLEAAKKAAPEIGKVVAEARSGAQEFGQTLDKAGAASKEVGATLQAAAETGARLEATARAMSAAAAEIRGMLEGYQKIREWNDSAGGRKSGPEDYKVMAESIAAASRDVRLLLDAWEKVRISGAAPAAAEARALVDHIAGRAAMLAGLVFVLALLWRRGRRAA